jgi:uncharacterized protein YjbI with pentapeptide repeats/energy-coupling factor transporter ATP-binding protein EcfA2
MATVRQAVRRDVFPALGAFIGSGVVVGVLVSVAMTALLEFSAGRRIVHGALSASLGAILGLFVGLGRSVWHFGTTADTSGLGTPRHQLWDPWLDSDGDGHEPMPQPIGEINRDDELPAELDTAPGFQARRAPVRPRIISPITGEAVPLDDQIGQIIDEGRYKRVGLIGGPGSGKSTAIRHLAAVLPPWALAKVLLADDPDHVIKPITLEAKDSRVIISAGNWLPPLPGQVIFYSLASWGQDDVIEYLLSAHTDRCASVMARLKASDDRGFLKGIPELWVVVLDQMARDESICDVRAALRSELSEWVEKHPRPRAVTEGFCLVGIDENADLVSNLALSTLSGDAPKRVHYAEEMLHLVRHRPVALLLAADRIKGLIECGSAESIFSHRFSYDLVQEAAMTIARNTVALQHLSEWLSRHEQAHVHPMAASLIHAAAPGWRPGPDCQPQLSGAYLARAVWPGLNLSRANLESTDFKEADLSGVNLKKSQATRARFPRANLQEAVLDSWVAIGADLSGANLRSVHAMCANFQQSNLAGARLIEANLWRANLQKANIEGADFTGANLEEARLNELKLSSARFDGARFGGADLRDCDLEDMVLAIPDFHDADLRNALLTGSRLQKANFTGADLRGAGLAEIEWPGANLHDADLRGASFHLGSSRSGLVDSPIACEGSRTGFYTDDYDDQDIKSAEEIRKANLRGADLTGANIEGVDFYLVDLRDAKYTRAQANHFHRCRAILGDRTR